MTTHNIFAIIEECLPHESTRGDWFNEPRDGSAREMREGGVPETCTTRETQLKGRTGQRVDRLRFCMEFVVEEGPRKTTGERDVFSFLKGLSRVEVPQS